MLLVTWVKDLLPDVVAGPPASNLMADFLLKRGSYWKEGTISLLVVASCKRNKRQAAPEFQVQLSS